MDKENPIGVIDSGVGGISILKALVENLPGENFIYFGDSANAPYGSRSKEEILRLTMNVVDQLMEHHCKAIVVACNTATAAAIVELREKYPETMIIGLEPAIKPAVLEHMGERVVVMATPFTLQSAKFRMLASPYEDKADVILLPAQEIVRYVEKQEYYSDDLLDYLRGLFKPYEDKPIGAIVLGCTHFPFAAKAIREVAGKQAVLYDSAMGVERQVVRLLRAKDLLNNNKNNGRVEIFNTAGDAAIELGYRLLNSEL